MTVYKPMPRWVLQVVLHRCEHSVLDNVSALAAFYKHVCRRSAPAPSTSAATFARRLSAAASAAGIDSSPGTPEVQSDTAPTQSSGDIAAFKQSTRRQQLLQCKHQQLQRRIDLLQAELAVREWLERIKSCCLQW